MNLTEKQQQIIGEMTDEFSTFNNRSKTNGGLIDVSRIKQNLIEDEMRKIEIEFRNIMFLEKMQEEVIQTVEHLNIDLNQLGLRAELTNNDIMIFSQTKYPNWSINIKLETSTKTCFLSTGDSIEYFDRWFYFYDTNVYDKITNKDISKITNNQYFQKKIQRMYGQQQKKISLLK